MRERQGKESDKERVCFFSFFCVEKFFLNLHKIAKKRKENVVHS